MPTFGDYESVQCLHASGVSDIYSARRIGAAAPVAGAPPAFVIHHFRPSVLWDEQRTRLETALFLNRADIQCRAAAAAPDHFAPIHATGLTNAADPADPSAPPSTSPSAAPGAYFVTDLYARSAQRLLDGRARLVAIDLRRLLVAVTAGLVDMQKSLERPHGNLRPANVLISSPDLEKARIVLSDPAPDSQAPANAEPDLLALGELFFQLVMLRPYEGAGGAPPAKEWSQLGKPGEKLRVICNLLLSPSTDAAQRNLPAILAQLQALKIVQKSPPRRLAALSAALACIALFCIYWFIIRAPREDYREDLWVKLCVSYQTWFEDLTNKLADPKQINQPGYPVRIVEILKEAGVKLGDQSGDPGPLNPNYVIDSKVGYDTKKIESLVTHIPDAAKDPTVAFRTHQATKIIDRIAGYLGSNATEFPVAERWPTLTDLDSLSLTFAKHDWNKPAAYLHDAAQAVSPKPSLAPKAGGGYDLATIDEQQAIVAAVRARAVAQPLEQAYLDLQKQADALARVPNPHFQAFAKFAEAFLISPKGDASNDDLTNLASKLTALKDLAGHLTTMALPDHPKVHWEELTTDPAYPTLPAPDRLDIATYQKVLSLAEQYTELVPTDDPRLAQAGDLPAPDAQPDDPPLQRSAKAWDARLTHLADNMHEVDLGKSAPEDTRKKLHAQLTRAAILVLRFWPRSDLPRTQQIIQSFASSVAPWPADQPLLPAPSPSPVLLPIQRDLTKLQAEVPADVASLNQCFGDIDVYRIKPAEWIGQRQAEKPPGPPAVPASLSLATAWTTHHEALLAKVRIDPDRLKTYDYRSLRDQEFKDLTDRLIALDRAVPATAPGLSPKPDGSWPEQLAYLQLVTHREALLAALVAKLPFPGDVPAFDDPAFQSLLREQVKTFVARSDDVRKLIADFLLAEDRLNHLYLRPREPAATDLSYAQLYDPWKTNELLHEDAAAAILKPLMERFERVESISRESSIATLLAVDGRQKELVLAAWRRLGEIDWTAQTPELNDELTLQVRAKESFAGLPADHRQALESELAAALPQRWTKHEAVITDQSDLESALTRRADFGVQDSQLDRRQQYNLAILTARSVDAAKPDPANPNADPKARDQFLKEQKILPFLNTFAPSPADPIMQNPAAVNLRTQLTKLISAGNQEITKAGPQLAGWRLQGNPTAEAPMITYTWTAPPRGPTYKLEFLQLRVADRAVYLAATPVTVGLFSDMLAASQKTAEIVKAFKKTSPVWTAEGPRGWVLDGGRFRPAPDPPGWLQPDTQSPEDTPGHYLMTDKSLTVAPPGESMPLQRVPPAAALYFARLLGCRLPTSEEWNAAYQRFEKNAPPNAPRDTWNLRDRAFTTQRDFSNAWENKNKVVSYPDEFIFFPTGAAAAGIIRGPSAKAYTRAQLQAAAPNRIAAGPEPYDDSTLFFRPIRTDLPPGTLQDLVGNVYTYVLNAPDQTVAIKTAGIPIDDAIAAIKANEKSVFVIGGSALSPPEILFDQPIPVDVDAAARKTGYPDVGFRLAFTAPIEAIHDGFPRIFKDVAKLIPAH